MSSERLLDLSPPPAAWRLAYGTEPHQFGDLYLPSGPGPYPVVVLIHGGFWRAAYNLDHIGHLAASLAQTGLACWSLEYRRIGNPGGGWPATFQDIARGAAHLSSIAGAYRLDLQRVVSMGHSAGGHLALWLAGVDRIPQDSELFVTQRLPLKGVISLAGVSDLHRAWELKLSNAVVEQFLEGAPREHPSRYIFASPIELLPLGLPQVLLHGVDDDIVPLEISQRYVRAAQRLGDPARLVTLPELGHFELIDPAAPAWSVLLDHLSRLLA